MHFFEMELRVLNLSTSFLRNSNFAFFSSGANSAGGVYGVADKRELRFVVAN